MGVIYLFVFTLILVQAQQAYAYFDPGTGSLLVQVLIAVFGGLLVFFAKIHSKTKQLLSKLGFRAKMISGKTWWPHLKHYVLAAAIGVYAAIFYSKGHDELLTVILNIFIFLSVSVFLTWVCAFIIRKKVNREKFLHGLLFVMLIYYMRLPVTEGLQILYIDTFDSHPSSAMMYISCLLIMFPLFGLGWLLSGNTYKVVVVIVVMTLVSSVKVITTAVERWKGARIANTMLDGVDGKDIFFGTKKPNVYFLLFDSYTNIEGLSVLGLTPDPTLTDYLNKNKFVTYPEFYTNMQPTINAMPSYFISDINYHYNNIYNVSFLTKQKITCGGGRVFTHFRKNNYITKIIMEDNKYFSLTGHLCSQQCSAERCLLYQNNNIFLIHLQLFDRIVLGGSGLAYTGYSSSFSYSRSTLSSLAREIGNKRQQFVYAHFAIPGHAEMTFTDEKGVCNEEVKIQNYKYNIMSANRIITKLVDMIIDSDPSALIILASDNGPFIFNRCASLSPLLTREEVVERQGAFLAIRWGKDYDGRYDNDIKSSANLFRYVFSYLLGHEKLLKDKPADDAFYLHKGKVVKSISDGIILPPPVAELRRTN